MSIGARMAPPSIFVTLAIICVSLSISEAFLAFTSGTHRSSLTHSSSRLWRIIRSTYDDGRPDFPPLFDDGDNSAASATSGRWRRASDGADAAAEAVTGDAPTVILTGMSPGPGNADASFEDGILTVIQKEDMKVKVFGAGFSAENRIKFDSREQEAGTDCEHQIEGVEHEFDEGSLASLCVCVCVCMCVCVCARARGGDSDSEICVCESDICVCESEREGHLCEIHLCEIHLYV